MFIPFFLGFHTCQVVIEEIPNNHLACMKPYKKCDKLPTSTGVSAGFLPSTVFFGISTLPGTNISHSKAVWEDLFPVQLVGYLGLLEAVGQQGVDDPIPRIFYQIDWKLQQPTEKLRSMFCKHARTWKLTILRKEKRLFRAVVSKFWHSLCFFSGCL